MARDLRICCVGDSYVAGVGDPEFQGWVGRLAVDSVEFAPTLYNLGVRRQTSVDIGARWLGECEQRLPAGCDGRVVLSFGVNDATVLGGRERVRPDVSAAMLAMMLERAAEYEWSVLVVSPPPVADPEHADRVAALDDRFAEVCADARVRYVRVHRALRESPVWMREVAAGDGAHPGAAGYGLMATLVAPHWRDWLAG
ncbi:GDSL-type esterase/lipase family protein [Nocardia takedensis]